jgi:hypothetical protein
MLSIEVFRPDEMVLTINQLKNKHTLKDFGRRLTNRQPDNPYIQIHEPEEVSSDSEEEPTQRRSKFKELLMKQQIKK